MSAKSPTSKKRKADEISEDVVIDVPHLSAPVWGGILDFMPYSEVRSALLVGKHIAVEAVKYVKTVNAMKSSELKILAARRFSNVEELKILCLLEGTGEFSERGDERFTLSLEAAHSIPSFLSAFPRLKRAFVGGRLTTIYLGIDETIDRVYMPGPCIGPEGHEEIIRGLIFTTTGAFMSGLLSPNLSKMTGINPYSWSAVRPCRLIDTETCAQCSFLCRHMPLRHMFEVSYLPCHFCLPKRKVLEIVGKRPGGKEAIEDSSEDAFLSFFHRHLTEVTSMTLITEEKATLIMMEYSRGWSDTRVWELSKFAFDELDKLIEGGLDPRRVQKENFFDEFNIFINDGRNLNIWARSTVLGLESRGFPVSCDNIITVDDS